MYNRKAPFVKNLFNGGTSFLLRIYKRVLYKEYATN